MRARRARSQASERIARFAEAIVIVWINQNAFASPPKKTMLQLGLSTSLEDWILGTSHPDRSVEALCKTEFFAFA
jgi:hypothetical protein